MLRGDDKLACRQARVWPDASGARCIEERHARSGEGRRITIEKIRADRYPRCGDTRRRALVVVRERSEEGHRIGRSLPEGVVYLEAVSEQSASNRSAATSPTIGWLQVSDVFAMVRSGSSRV